MKLNINQLQNLLLFLNRVELKGNEAEELVRLKMIIVEEGNKLGAEAQTPKKEEKKEDKKN